MNLIFWPKDAYRKISPKSATPPPPTLLKGCWSTRLNLSLLICITIKSNMHARQFRAILHVVLDQNCLASKLDYTVMQKKKEIVKRAIIYRVRSPYLSTWSLTTVTVFKTVLFFGGRMSLLEVSLEGLLSKETLPDTFSVSIVEHQNIEKGAYKCKSRPTSLVGFFL